MDPSKKEVFPLIFMFYLGPELKPSFKIILLLTIQILDTRTLVTALVSEQNFVHAHCAFYRSVSALIHKDKKTIFYFLLIVMCN